MDPWLEPAPDFTDAGLAAAYDELSLWAAPFDAKRQPRELLERRVLAAGFRIRSVHPSEFSLRYSGAEALFRHHFIRLGFLPSWREVLAGIELSSFIPRLARALDDRASRAGALNLEIPFLCFDCVRG